MQKARQFALRFYIQKSGHFTLRDLHGILEIGGGRGAFCFAKNSALCVTFLYCMVEMDSNFMPNNLI